MTEEIVAENKSTTEGASVLPEMNIDPVVLEEAVKAGVLYGRKKSKTNPRMHQYIFTTRNGVEIFDFSQTLTLLEKATTFLQGVSKNGFSVLVVGTQPASKGLVEQFGVKFNFPTVTERWLGGTLTNFKTIFERLQYYLNLKADKAAGRLEKYTKKERGEFDKQIEKMTRLFGGLAVLKDLPRALIVVNPVYHDIAVHEARKMKIPVIALMSSDANPETVEYPVPANDNAKSSVAWFLAKLEAAVEAGIKERGAK